MKSLATTIKATIYFLCCTIISIETCAQQWEWVIDNYGATNVVNSSLTTDLAGNIYQTGTYTGNINIGVQLLGNHGGKDIFLAKYNSSGSLTFLKHAGSIFNDVAHDIDYNSATQQLWTVGAWNLDYVYTEDPFYLYFDGQIVTPYAGDPGIPSIFQINLFGDLQQYYPGSQVREEYHHVSVVKNQFVVAIGNWTWGIDPVDQVDQISFAEVMYGHSFDANAYDASHSYNLTGLSANINSKFQVVGNFSGDIEMYWKEHQISSFGNSDALIGQYDINSLGEMNFVWVKTIYSQQGEVSAQDVGTDAYGNSYVVGTFSSDANFSGTVLTTSAESEAFCAKYDFNGELVWVIKSNNSGRFTGLKIATCGAGNSYVSGTMEAGQGWSQLALSPNGAKDIYVIEVDNAGVLSWGMQAEDLGHANFNVQDIELDWSGHAYLTGTFDDPVQFGAHNLGNPYETDMFIAKIGIQNNLIAYAGTDQTISCSGPLTRVQLDGSRSEGEIDEYIWSGDFGEAFGVNVSLDLPPGEHTIDLIIRRGCVRATDEITIIIEDQEVPFLIRKYPPEILDDTEGQYHTIHITDMVESVENACGSTIEIDEVVISSVSSDEPEVLSRGDTTNDIIIAEDCKSVDVRMELDPQGNGRVYSVELQVVDPDGNPITDEFQIQIPPVGRTAFDDGAAYRVSCLEDPAPSMPQHSMEAVNIAELVNYPNPFVDQTSIKFSLSTTSSVVLEVYNNQGQKISTIYRGILQPGTHEFPWSTVWQDDVLYLYQLRLDGAKYQGKMIRQP